MKKRLGLRGQSASNAAALVGIIALILIFYILFLPPAEREAILGDDFDMDQPGKPGAQTAPELLLRVTPGTLEFFPERGDHQLPSVHVFSRIEAVTLATLPAFSVHKGWFAGRTKAASFSIDNIDRLEEVLLSFNLPEHNGVLTIMLNGEQVFEADIDQYNVDPIRLPKHMLRADNDLLFSVSGVGIQFWQVNRYDLRNIRVIGNIRDKSRHSSQNIFTLSPTEKRNILGATLMFVAACDPEEVGPLEILVNGNMIYSAVPDCDTTNRQTMPGDILQSGANTVQFRTTRGDYRIEQPTIITDLQPPQTFIEYFEINRPLFDAVLDGNQNIFLEIDFVDDGERKRGELNVNGHLTFIDQREPFYTRRIDEWIVPGARNYIELVPETPMSIPEVRVLRRSPFARSPQSGLGVGPNPVQQGAFPTY